MYSFRLTNGRCCLLRLLPPHNLYLHSVFANFVPAHARAVHLTLSLADDMCYVERNAVRVQSAFWS